MNTFRRSGPKIGRNDLCPCGSRRKFKSCHGSPAYELPFLFAKARLDRRIEEEAKQLLAEHKARAIQRQAQQGYGRPIISDVHQGYRFVAVGNQLYWEKSWRTFFDFLGDYIKIVLGSPWGNSEIGKPEHARHPVLTWYHHICQLQKKSFIEPGKVYSVEMTGAASAYYRLAYSLYLVAHNVTDIQTRLIERLKNKDNFHGAYYETIVAAQLINAGFELEFENEDDRRRTHCEFTATASTGKQFSVEAKSRPLVGQYGRGKLLRVERQLRGALEKKAAHTRIVFIDLNVPTSNDAKARNQVFSRAQRILRRAQTRQIDYHPAPPAYVFLSNVPDQYNLEDTCFSHFTVGEGFNIADFGPDVGFESLRAAVRAREKHIEVFQLMQSLREHSRIPITFDGALPSHAFDESISPLKIGHEYRVPRPDGKEALGTLTMATVLADRKLVYGEYMLESGENIIATTPLTDDELLDYRRHPDTFFGVHAPQGRRIEGPLEIFDFFFSSYKNTPRETLLELLKTAPDFDELRKLGQKDLVEICCERRTYSVLRQQHATQPVRGE